MAFKNPASAAEHEHVPQRTVLYLLADASLGELEVPEKSLHCQQYDTGSQLLLSLNFASMLSSRPRGLGGSGGSSFTALLTSHAPSSFGGARIHLWTVSSSFFSPQRITIASRSHTDVVHIASGPLCFGLFSLAQASALEDALSGTGRFWTFALRRMRLAIVTSVKSRSPTIMSASSGIGVGRDAKYLRMAAIQE